jgi:hypothetical protein
MSRVEPVKGGEFTEDKRGRAAAVRLVPAPASTLAKGNIPITVYIDAKETGSGAAAVAMDGLVPLRCRVTIAGGSGSAAWSDVAASLAAIVSGAMVSSEPPMLVHTNQSAGCPVSEWRSLPNTAEFLAAHAVLEDASPAPCGGAGRRDRHRGG